MCCLEDDMFEALMTPGELKPGYLVYLGSYMPFESNKWFVDSVDRWLTNPDMWTVAIYHSDGLGFVVLHVKSDAIFYVDSTESE